MEPAGPLGDLARLVREQPRQRRVEADEQRLVALAREPAGLLDREHRLAGPGTADDRRPPHAAQHVEGRELLVGQLDDLAFAVGDLAAEQRPKLERRGDGRRRAARRPWRRALAWRRRTTARSTDRPSRAAAGCAAACVASSGLVEDELGVGVGADQGRRVEAREVDVGERDGVAGDRVEAGLPGRQLARAWRPGCGGCRRPAGTATDRAAGRRPTSARVSSRLTGPALTSMARKPRSGVGDDEVGLALALGAVAAEEPGDVRRGGRIRSGAPRAGVRRRGVRPACRGSRPPRRRIDPDLSSATGS